MFNGSFSMSTYMTVLISMNVLFNRAFGVIMNQID